MAQVNAGRVRFVSRGEYNNSTQYYLFDLVDYNGSSYFAKANTTGNVPTNTTYWQLVAEKGNTGGDGPVGPTGNGIASIVKTASAGLIDTYTITFTDGTTTTFNITNGQDGDVTQEYVDEENERLRSLYNVLPKVSDSGESVTLNNTGDTMLYKMDLKGNTSQDVVQGEVGLEVEDTSIYVDDVNEDKENYITLKGNTSQETTTGKNFYSTSMLPVTEYGITISKNANGDIVLNGTPNFSEGYKTFYTGDVITVEAGTYTLSVANKIAGIGCVVGGFNGGCNLTLNDTVTSKSAYANTPQNVNPAINIRYDVGTLTNFVLNPQMEKSSSATTYEPYTNGASPNPDYPQEIEVVTGLNEVKVEGKNLFDVSKLENSGWNAPNTPQRLVMFLDKVSQGTKISVTNLDTTTYRFAVGFSNLGYASRSNTIVNESGWVTNSTYTITANGNGYPLLQLARIDNGNISPSDVEGKFQYEYGDTATTYEAYQGASYPVNLGKNLLNYDNNTNVENRYIGGSGNYVSGGNYYYINEKINVNSNTPYTISYGDKIGGNVNLRIAQYKNDGTFISRVVAITQNKKYTITTNENCSYVIISVEKMSNEKFVNLQFEKGSEATSYAPYFTPIELCKIGTYQDRIYKSNGNWYLHKEIGKVVLNGSETWTNSGSNSNNFYYMMKTIVSDMLSASSDNAKVPIISNYFTDDFSYNSLGNSNAGTNGICVAQNHTITICHQDYDKTQTANFKTWLSTHNTNVYYILATPTDTQITDTTLVNQLNALYNATIYSTTHINTETSNLLPYIDLKYNVVTASPSPDRASEVEVVKGNNTITISNEDGTKTQSYNITLGNLELCKIGNYQDYFYKDNGNWYKYGAIGKTTDVVGSTSITINDMINNGGMYSLYGGTLSGKTITYDSALLRQNTIYYPLSTPTTTQITDQLLVSQLDELQKAMSYYDKTLISQVNDDKPFILDVVAIRDLQDIFNL